MDTISECIRFLKKLDTLDGKKFIYQYFLVKYNYSDAAAGANQRFEVGDGLKNPLFAGQQVADRFDYVISLAVLHHIPGDILQLKFLKNIHNSLKANGQMLISVWNRHHDRYKKYLSKSQRQIANSLYQDLAKNDTIVPWMRSRYYRFIHAFTKEELTDLAKQAGFINIKCFCADKFGLSTKTKALNIYLMANK